MGDSASNRCQDGYKPIIDVDNCESAASGLGLKFKKPKDIDMTKAICRWCPKCGINPVIMTDSRPQIAMLCEQGI